MKIPGSVVSNSEEDTEMLAKEFSAFINEGDMIVLNGNLGSGKTFFIKKVLSNFDIKNVNSPSFAIVNEYNGNLKAYHFDFYRLKNIEELIDVGWEDYINDNEAVIFIEWGNLLAEALPKRRYEINILILDEGKRKFEFKKYQ